MAEQFFLMPSSPLALWGLLLVAAGLGAACYDLVRRWWWAPRERARIDAERQVLGGTLMDLRERMQHQEHMASVGKIASGVAHEINNPAGYIMSNLKTLKRYMTLLLAREAGPLSEAERQELLFVQSDLPTLMDDCLDGVQRISGIVRSLRSYTRAAESTEQIPHTWDDLVRNAVRLTHAEIHHLCRLEQQLHATHSVRANEREITQVLANLILNARDAMALSGQGSLITLRTQDVDGGAELLVEDDGPGVPPHLVERIFEPFFTTKASNKGTGLGLSICRDIIEANHGGQLRYEAASNGGARFIIYLPKAGAKTASEQ
ncbi:ATP-binding protein [Salinispirillum sp. LH 10-3-1]|uniref:histidine kinase n=1 Tax=Salinispirillum sp. LH 10-3-1 TaxID=2952525 RepID=A0AB38YI63_9GAMM